MNWLYIPRIALVVLAVSLTGANAVESTSYLPLAKATVVAKGPAAETLLAAISEFAEAEGLSLQLGNFLKHGRPVVNETIRLRGDLYVHVTNFQESEEFEIVVYSHEPDSAWRTEWGRLIATISSRLPNAITIQS